MSKYTLIEVRHKFQVILASFVLCDAKVILLSHLTRAKNFKAKEIWGSKNRTLDTNPLSITKKNKPKNDNIFTFIKYEVWNLRG